MLLGFALVGWRVPMAWGQLNIEPEQLDGVGTADKRGDQVDGSLAFTRSDGSAFTLGEYFDGETPIVLLLAYYDCPLLCDLMIESTQNALNEADRLRPGRDYHLLVVSIDHTNTPAQAIGKREGFLSGFIHSDLDDEELRSVVFALSEAGAVRSLADGVGYYYRYLPKEQEFAHPPALFFLTPDGVVSGMLIGINTPGRQVAMALSDASDGRTAGLFDVIAFSCFAYDPRTGKYVISPMNVMRIGAIGVAVLLLGGIALAFVRGWLRSRARGSGPGFGRGVEGELARGGGGLDGG